MIISTSSRIFIIILAVIVLSVDAWIIYEMREEEAPAQIQEEALPAETPTETPAEKPAEVPTEIPAEELPPTKKDDLPASLSLSVPFTPQAPTGNWDALHDDACEEASALMAAAYFEGDTRAVIPAAEVEESITTLTEWQKEHFGYYLDSNAAETAQMIEGVYGLKAHLIHNFTEDDVKRAIFEDKLVLILVDGRLIGNPHYVAPGPEYHMLVIRGYTPTTVITNDPGTRHGANYSYPFETLNKATVDWDHATGTIDSSKSVIIVVSK